MEVKEPIRTRDFRAINILSVICVLGMWGLSIYQIITQPDMWIFWAIIDFMIGCINLFAIMFSMSVQRDIRVHIAQLKDVKAGMK